MPRLDEIPASAQGSRLGFVVFRSPCGPKTSQIDTVGLHVWGLENIANTVGLDFWEHENNANTMGLNVWAQKHRKYRETRCLRANQPQVPFLGARNSLSTANTVGLGLQLEAERCRTSACVLRVESCRAGCWQGVVCVVVRLPDCCCQGAAASPSQGCWGTVSTRARSRVLSERCCQHTVVRVLCMELSA